MDVLTYALSRTLHQVTSYGAFRPESSDHYICSEIRGHSVITEKKNKCPKNFNVNFLLGTCLEKQFCQSTCELCGFHNCHP